MNWLWIGIGVALVGVAVWAFKRPRHFLKGRKARLWVNMIGEAKTLKLIQFLSAPLVLLVGVFMITQGFRGCDNQMKNCGPKSEFENFRDELRDDVNEGLDSLNEKLE